VTKIEIALLEAAGKVCEELDWTVTYAELQLALLKVQMGWAERTFMAETPREGDFTDVSENAAKQIFAAGRQSESFDTWWEANRPKDE